MLETKIKEVKQEDKLPALYSTEKRESVILVSKILPNGKLEGIAVHPKSVFGSYSVTWSAAQYKRMSSGSEFTLKFIQE